MSGPTTVILGADPATALLAAAALRAAEAVREAHRQAAALREAHTAERDANAQHQRGAAQQGAAATESALATAEARFDRLVELAGTLDCGAAVAATRPRRPSSDETHSLAAYRRELEALADELQSFLLTEAARRRETLEDFPDFALPATLAKTAAALTAAQRLLARIAHLGEMPAEMAALARELDATPPGERAELLAMELRQRIQRHAETCRQRELEAAKALIVERTLQDLGYQVEAIGATLFVEGGVVHFRKPGWGDYMVRMRVDAATSTANFNVIRAVEAGNNERSVLDHLAEDRWCAEFPALLKALEARGIGMEITRRLEAGELPVQLVARDRLPRFADEESARPTKQAIARKIE